MDFTQSLTNHIEKLVGTLKGEDELKEVLKRKFTKKEFKVFTGIESGVDAKTIATHIKADEQRVEELYKSCCKKLNQELFKKELVDL